MTLVLLLLINSLYFSGITLADYQPLIEIPGTELAIGSLVEVSSPGANEDLYGVIRWIGIPPGIQKNILVGIEVEDESNLKNVMTSDGRHNGVRYVSIKEYIFSCGTLL